jgi:cell fate regulator YaaT (PSP1 superfamily)
MTQIENNNTAKPKTPPKKLLLVRFGKMGTLGWFEHNEAHVPKTKPHVIVNTSRGVELGQLVGAVNYKSGQFRITPEQTEAYFGPTETGQPVVTETGTFVRFATPEDIREQQHLELSAVEEAKACERLTHEMNLPMKIVEAEHLFGGERIVIYFTSEGRVDFRELVKRMAKEYQTRIELRQIGSRDEAKLVGDYETCGQECCCKRYLKILAPVNMRMAKLQKATLDPSKISGHCGRLKCCLRYEDATYLELRENLPRRNDTINTPQGQGRVYDVQILTQLVVVQYENGERQAWPVEELRVFNGGAPAEAPCGKVCDKKCGQAGEYDFSEMESAVEAEAPAETEEKPSLEKELPNEPAEKPSQQPPQQGQGQNRQDGNRDRNRNKKFKKRNNQNRGGNNPNNPNQNPNQNQGNRDRNQNQNRNPNQNRDRNQNQNRGNNNNNRNRNNNGGQQDNPQPRTETNEQ